MPGSINWWSVFSRTWQDRAFDQQVRRALTTLDHTERTQLKEFRRLLLRRHQLERQIASLDVAHRLIGIWRLVHIPMGATLFTAAFIHVAVALLFKGLG